MTCLCFSFVNINSDWPHDSHYQGIQIDDLVIDPLAQEVRVSGKAIKLTRKEFHFLWILGSDPERVFSRKELLDLVWGAEVNVETRTVDAHIARLRRLLKMVKNRTLSIETVWGIGYCLRKRIGQPGDR